MPRCQMLKKTISLLMLSVFLLSASVAHACQLRCWLADPMLDGEHEHQPEAGMAHAHVELPANLAPPVVKDARGSSASRPVCGANSACLLASVLAPAAQHQLHEPMSVERAIPSVHESFSSFLSKPPRLRPKS